MIRSFPPPQYILVIRCVSVEIPTPKCTGTCKFFDTAHDKTWRLLWYANARGLSLTPYFYNSLVNLHPTLNNYICCWYLKIYLIYVMVWQVSPVVFPIPNHSVYHKWSWVQIPLQKFKSSLINSSKITLINSV